MLGIDFACFNCYFKAFRVFKRRLLLLNVVGLPCRYSAHRIDSAEVAAQGRYYIIDSSGRAVCIISSIFCVTGGKSYEIPGFLRRARYECLPFKTHSGISCEHHFPVWRSSSRKKWGSFFRTIILYEQFLKNWPIRLAKSAKMDRVKTLVFTYIQSMQ